MVAPNRPRRVTADGAGAARRPRRPQRTTIQEDALMNIHEYQGKAVLKEFGLPVSQGRAIFSADEAEAAARELGGPVWVVKSQIHAGGRGKGRFKEREAGDKGGVRLAQSIAAVKTLPRRLSG